MAQREVKPDNELPASPGSSPLRPRHTKIPSAEFKTSREIRPLYLLERNRKSDELDEMLPALPSSGSPSRASSATDTDAEYESALESPRLSASITPDDPFFEPLDAVSSLLASQPGPELQHPELADREIEEVDGSGQVTPKASDFTAGLSQESAGPSRDVLAAALEDIKAQSPGLSRHGSPALRSVSPLLGSPLAPSAPLDDTKMREVSAPRSRDDSPSTSSSRLQSAALGAAIGGLTAAALRDRSPIASKDRSGDEQSVQEAADEPATSAPAESKRKGKKVKGKKSSISESLLPTPVQGVSDPKQFIPTFVDNEDDWGKNKSESVITDDATLVGEPGAGPSSSKELHREKVLESTAPQSGGELETRRAVPSYGSEHREVSSEALQDVNESKSIKQKDLDVSVSAPVEAVDEMVDMPVNSITASEDLEKTLADVGSQQEAPKSIVEQVAALTAKGKKNKKNKKGKRGSQQLGSDLSALPELPAEDEILPAPETQEETIEQSILAPAFAAEEQKVDAVDIPKAHEEPVALGSTEKTPDVAPEPVATVEAQKDRPSTPKVAEPLALALEQMTPTTREVEQPQATPKEAPTVSESESGKSGWGSSLLGAFGWGKKKPTSPTPAPKPKADVAPPVVEEKRDLQMPPKPVVSAEIKQREAEPQVVEPKVTELDATKQPESSAQGEPSREVTESTALTEDITRAAAPAFVAPQTAYFADDGRPAFTFPAFTSKPATDAAPAPPDNEESKDGEASRSLPDVAEVSSAGLPTAYSAVMPPTAVFTDNGKPHFTFPQRSVEAASDVSQPPTERTVDAVPRAMFAETDNIAPSDATRTYDAFMPRTGFFADDGKPHFTFSQPITQASPASSQLPEEQALDAASREVLPEVPRELGPVYTAPMPQTAFFTDNGKPHFTFPQPTSAPPAETVEQSTNVADLGGASTGAAESTSGKKKKSKKDKKKRGSVAEQVPEPIEADTAALSAPLLEGPTADVSDRDVNQGPGDVVVQTPAVDEANALLRGPEPDAISQNIVETTERAASSAPFESGLSSEQSLVSGREEAVQDTTAPLEKELVAPSSKKKNKKSKKAKLEDKQSSAADVNEPSLPATDSLETKQGPTLDVPLPVESLQQGDEVVEPIQERAILEGQPLPEPTAAAPDSATAEPARDLQETQPELTVADEKSAEALPTAAEEDWGYTPKKKGKKSKSKSGTQTPEVQPESAAEPSIATVELLDVPKNADQLSEITPASALEPIQDIEAPFEQDRSIDAAPRQSEPAEAKEDPPLAIEPTAETEITEPMSKKDKKKKKKGKKGKGTETPVEELHQSEDAPVMEQVADGSTMPENIRLPEETERELELPLETATAPRELVSEITEEPVPSAEPTIPATTSSESTQVEPQLEATATTEEQPTIVQSTETVVEDESAPVSSSKKDRKKKKGKKGKAIEGSEPSTPVTEEQRELELPAESALSAPDVEPTPSAPEQVTEEEAPREAIVDSQIVPEEQSTKVPSQLEPVADVPVSALAESHEEQQQQSATVAEEEVAAPSKKSKKKTKKAKAADLDSPVVEESVEPEPSVEPILSETVPESVPTKSTEVVQDVADVPTLDSSRELNESMPTEPTVPVVEEPVATSKKNKKKKGKKGTATDTEPSTPITEEPEPQYEERSMPAVEEKLEQTTVSTAQHPDNDIQTLPETSGAPLESHAIETTLPTAVDDVSQDTAISSAVEPIAEAETAELTSKKSKKKGKKAKSADLTEPSTPITEEPVLPAEPLSQTAPVEKSIDVAAQSLPEEAITEPSGAPVVENVSPEPVSTPKVEESTELPTLDAPIEEVSTLVEQPAAEEPTESTSKKSKKKKGKKAKASDEPESEVALGSVQEAPVVDTAREIEQLEQISHATDATSIEAPLEAFDPISTPTTELPFERELAMEMGQLSEPIDFEVPMETPSRDYATPLEQELTEPQPATPIETEQATTTSKKAKKKKGKKSASVSEPQTPVAEVESYFPVEKTANPKEQTIALEEPSTVATETVPRSTEEQALNQTDAPSDSAPLTGELGSEKPDAVAAPTELTEQPQEPVPDAPLSKKDKKKAKKNKRVSVTEETPSAPATPVDEVTRELNLEDSTAEAAIPDQATVSEPVSPRTIPSEVHIPESELPTTTLDDSTASHQPLAGAEAERALDLQDPVSAPTEELTTGAEPSQPEDPTIATTNKDKKKAKKNKRVSIAEPTSTPDTPVEEKELTLEEQPVSVPHVQEPAQDEAVSSSVDVQPVASTQPTEEASDLAKNVTSSEQPESIAVVAEEGQEQLQEILVEDSPALSKKEKKKGKKAKRVSIAEPEFTPPTPREEKTGLALPLEETPVNAPAAVADEPVSEVPVSEEQISKELPAVEKSVSKEVPVEEPVSTPVVPEPPVLEEPTASLSKKDKKKAKKAKRGSVAETDSTPATPSEEKTQLELPQEEAAVSAPPVTDEPISEVPAVEESVSKELPTEDIVQTPVPADEPALPLVDEEPSAPLSKKDKKKGKKAKRGSVTESADATPLDTPVEEKAQDPLDVQVPEVSNTKELVEETPVVADNTSTPVAVEDVTTEVPIPAVVEEVPAEVAAEESAPLSKKDKKKAKKASKRGSVAEPEISEPTTPLEQPIEEAKDFTQADARIELSSTVEEPTVPTSSTTDQPAPAIEEVVESTPSGPTIEQTKDIPADDQALTSVAAIHESTTAVPERSQSDIPITATEEVSKEVQVDEPAPVSKKDKKKAKKGKRGSVAEPDPSAEATAVDSSQPRDTDTGKPKEPPVVIEEPTVSADGVQAPQVGESKDESQAAADTPAEPTEPTIVESSRIWENETPVPTEPATPVVEEPEPAEWATMSKAQKKKAKKAKRASVAEGTASQPETPAEEFSRELDVEPQTVEEANPVKEQPAASTSSPGPVVEVNEPSAMPKDTEDSKSTSVVENVPSEPATLMKEASTDIAPEPITAPAIETVAVADKSVPESLPVAEETVNAPLSKKDKKKAKKAKRGSVVEESSQPATPIDELARELVVEDQPAIEAQPLTFEPTQEPLSEAQPISEEIPPDKSTFEATPASPAVEEPASTLSKKDKKKAKKQGKKTSATETETTVPFLAQETPEEANVSDTQSSPPPSIPSETPLLLSGIPTSYPHVRDGAFVVNDEEEMENEKKNVESTQEEVVRRNVDVDAEKEVEQKELEEPAKEDVEVETSKKSIKSKKGKKRGSFVEEQMTETPAPEVVDTTTNDIPSVAKVESVVEELTTENLAPEVAVTTPIDVSTSAKTDPLVEETVTQSRDIPVAEPTTQAEIAQSEVPESQPKDTLAEQPATQVEILEPERPKTPAVEETKEVSGDVAATVPDQPSPKKVRKHKLAALFEQKAAEDKPMLPRKRAPWAKPVVEASTAEPVAESSKNVEAQEVKTAVVPEPIVSVEETPKASKDTAEPGAVKIEEPALESKVGDLPVEGPTQPIERALDTTALPVDAPISQTEQAFETTPDIETSTLSKKDKKKAKKNKKQSGTATPTEIVSEPKAVDQEESMIPLEEQTATVSEEPTTIKSEEAVPDIGLIVEQEKPIKLTEALPEQSRDVQTETTDTVNLQEVAPEQPTNVDLPSEPQPDVDDASSAVLSKKEKKKKSKKAKKDSGNATPAEDAFSEEQPAMTGEPRVPEPERSIVEATAETTPIVEELRQESQDPTTTDKAIDIPLEEATPAVLEQSADPSQQDVYPTAETSTEAVEPVEDEQAAKTSTKDKKKSKKFKKQGEDVILATESVVEPSTGETVDTTIEQRDTIVPGPNVETSEPHTIDKAIELPQDVATERAVGILPEETFATTVETHDPIVEASQRDITDKTSDAQQPEEALPIPTEMNVVAPEPVEAAPETKIEPAQALEDDWGYTPPKKDKKKGKKGKKSDSEPVVEALSEVQTATTDAIPTPSERFLAEAQPTNDNIKVANNKVLDVTAAEPHPPTDLTVTPEAVEDVQTSDRALDTVASDVPEAAVLPVPAEKPAVQPDEDVSAPLSKKDKKKAKKAKKASGTATPITEDVPTLEPEHVQDTAVAEQTVEELPATGVTETTFLPEPVPDETREVEKAEASPIVPIERELEMEPASEEATLPTASTKKSKKKSKKSAAATPIIEDLTPAQPETAQELEVSVPTSEVTPKHVPATTTEVPTMEESQEVEQPIARPVTPVETETSKDHVVLPTESKKKSKKKGKKSGTATPLTEDVLVPEPEPKHEFEVQPEPQVTPRPEPVAEDEVAHVQDIQAVPTDLDAVKEEQTTSEQQPDIPMVPQEQLVEIPVEEALPSTSKKSKKKAKKSGTATPIVEDVVVQPEVEAGPALANAEDATLHDNSSTLQNPGFHAETSCGSEGIEPQIEPSMEVQIEPQLEVVAHPTMTQPEPSLNESVLPTTSKKNKKKKGKKSEPQTPINEEAPMLPSVEAVQPLEEIVVENRESVAPLERVEADLRIQEEEAQPITAPAVDVMEPRKSAGEDVTLEAPAILASAEPEPTDVTMAENLVTIEPTPEETAASSSKKKKKGKKGKGSKSEPQTPVVELSDPMDVEARTLQDVTEGPSREAEAQLPVSDATAAADVDPAVSTNASEPVDQPFETAPEPQPVQAKFDVLAPGAESVAERAIMEELSQPPQSADEIVSTPIEEPIQELQVQDEQTPAPTKSKKTKKDKKNKKQSISLDAEESVQPADVDVQVSNAPDNESSLPVPSVQAELLLPEPSIADQIVDAPTAEPQASNEMVAEHVTPHAIPEPTVLPQALETEDQATREVREEDTSETSLSRKASKKAKKGKKGKETITQQIMVSEPHDLPSSSRDADVEMSMEPAASTHPGSPLLETLNREPQPDSTAIDLPVYGANAEPSSQSIDAQEEAVAAIMPTSDAIDKTVAEVREIEDVKPIEVEEEALPSRKSKKDKKKGKKSKSASGISTPIETVSEAPVVPGDMGEHAQPMLIEEPSRDIQIAEPQVTVEEVPSTMQDVSEIPASSNIETIDTDIALPEAPLTEAEQTTFETADLDLSLSRSASKKSKKKKGKKAQEVTEEMSVESPPAAAAEPVAEANENLPTIAEASREAQASPPPPAFETLKPVDEAFFDVPMTANRSHQASRELTEPLDRQQQAPSQLSPELQAAQDEATDLRTRSEALDQALALHEDVDEPSPSQPTSFFDVIGKLSKKDKKKGKKVSPAIDSETTTPAPGTQDAVETKEMVEEQSMADVPSALSQKEKEVEPRTLRVEEPVDIQETVVEQPRDPMDVVTEPATSTPIAQAEAPIVSIEEVAATPLEGPAEATEDKALVASGEPREAAMDESLTVSKNLSKKDKKKKAKALPIADDEPMPETSEATPEISTETREVTELQDQPAFEPVSVVEDLTRITSTSGPVVEEERPALSRKQSKKDKKKSKKVVAIDEPVVHEEEQDVEMDDAARLIEPTVVVPEADTTDTTQAPATEAPAEPFNAPTPVIEEHQPSDLSRGFVNDVPEANESAAQVEGSRTVAPKSSEKEKRKSKISTTPTLDVIEDNQPITSREPFADTSLKPESTAAVLPEQTFEDEWAMPAKKTKKEKRKSKASSTAAVLPTPEPALIPQEPAQEDTFAETSRGVTEDFPAEAQFGEPEVETVTKLSKREKRTSKKTTPAYEEDIKALEPELDQQQTMQEIPVQSSRALPAIDPPAQSLGLAESSAPSNTLEAPEQPTLARKASRKHKLAALFEQGASKDGSAAERELRRGGTGSVKNLAEQYESQSRSATPVLQPSHEKRTISRVASDARLGSQSPKRDLDFAGTLAAGLKASGFDDKYVVDDSTFHQSTSPTGVRDLTTDDDVAAALDSASSSKFATRGWTTPTSSPKLRPTKESESSALPPIEVAIASSTDNASFDPLDVLNDPTFSKRNTSPGILEEADPDELGSKLKMNKKSKGKKKRTSLPDSHGEDAPVTIEDAPPSTTARCLEHAIPLPEAEKATMATVIPQEEAQDDLWSATPTKSKKSKKDKKRASHTQDSVEYAATGTPAVETLTQKPPAVETPVADSTRREGKLRETSLPGVEHAAPINRSLFSDPSTTTTGGKELGEYPFPQVAGIETTTMRSVEDPDLGSRIEQEEEDQTVASSKKKAKKSRKEKDSTKRAIDTATAKDISESTKEKTSPETHKRRSHPVTFEEDQPYEKRPHLREPTPESASQRGPSQALEPTWSFAGVRDSAVEVADSPVQDYVPTFHESTRDSGYHDSGHSPIVQQEPIQQEATPREKKRRSKEPKTPLERALRNSQVFEDSPALPEYPASTEATTPSAPEYATKERASYLFDSSPSTREYATSPAIPPTTPAHDSRRTMHSPTREIAESPDASRKHSRSRSKDIEDKKEIASKESYQSIFGDPSQKKSEQTATLATPVSRHGRTPSNKGLQTITETSPDDSPLHKKGRAINDVGAPDRGTKSARRTETPKPFTDRLKSPPPVTPTPLARSRTPGTVDTTSGSSPLANEVDRSMTLSPARRLPRSSPSFDNTGRSSPLGDTPWHQVHDKVDRTMTLSPARRLPRSSPSTDPIKQQMAELRSASVASQRSMSNISKLRSPDQERPLSSASNRSTQSLRRMDRSASGDLRNVARLGEARAQDARSPEPNLSGIALAAGASAAIAGIAAASKYDPVRGAGKGRRASMAAAETFVSPILVETTVAQHTNRLQEAWGEAPGSPMSPTRPPSVRKRQSMQIMDLQSQLDQLAAHNSSLEDAKARAEETLQAANHQRQIDEQLVAEATEARDREIHQRDIDIAQLKDTLQRLHEEIARLTELNNTLTEANRNLANDTNERYAQLQSEGQLIQQQYESSQREIEQLRTQHDQMTRGMEGVVRDEIGIALDDRNAEIDRLNTELAEAKEQIKTLQKQILASKKPSESFLTIRDEDYFDSACQQLCQHVQQWVLRFSKFSDTRPCRLSSEIAADTRLDTATRQKIDTRLDNSILDGSDVDSLLADRVKRRDVFMSVVMTMIWEYVFTRYLFGMDREQRQKLKSLEKTLSEVGKYMNHFRR